MVGNNYCQAFTAQTCWAVGQQNQINFKETMTDKSILILPVPNKNFKTSSNLNFTVNTRFLITYNKYLKKNLFVH